MGRPANLTEDEYDAAREVGLIRLVRHNTKLYNQLCNRCRLKTVRITQRRKVKIEDYCLDCQEKAEKILRSLC